MIKHIYKIEGKFEFESGGSIDNLEVAYHTSPFGYSPDKKVIWLCHALTADSDPEGSWWPALVGPGRLIDTGKYFVICANVLGSACGSSSPASTNPKTGKPYYFDFPRVTVRDTVRAFDLLRQHLGIEKIDMLIGTSMGGFMSFEWAVMRPGIFGKSLGKGGDPALDALIGLGLLVGGQGVVNVREDGLDPQLPQEGGGDLVECTEHIVGHHGVFHSKLLPNKCKIQNAKCKIKSAGKETAPGGVLTLLLYHIGKISARAFAIFHASRA